MGSDSTAHRGSVCLKSIQISNERLSVSVQHRTDVMKVTYHCENVSHVLWECLAYSSTRACFIKKLQELLEDEYEDFESLDKVEKSSYVLGSEL